MSPLEPGSQLAGYHIDGVAGGGGMGVVYRATQQGLDRTVALKVITPAFADDDEFRERFKRESRLAASIEHPNVIPIYEAGESDGVLYLSMRFVDGTDLKSLLEREGTLEPRRAARILAQVAEALDAAHAAGLVHRDIKPANILMASSDHAYLTDFGLTKRAASESALTKTGQMVGTVDYVAPEQVEGSRVDARTDVYSLACVLYHLLTGRVPYDKPTDMARLFAHVNERPPRPSDAIAGLPPELDEVVTRGMAKKPDDRYLSAGDLGRAALAAAEHRHIAQPERSVARGAAAPDELHAAPTVASAAPGAGTAGAPAAPAGRRGNTRRWAVAAAALVIAGVAAALVAGGGGGGGGGSSDKLPPGGQMTVVNNAPPPKRGDEVLAAGKTQVHSVRYQVVVSRPGTKGPKRGAVPVYFNEYMGRPLKLLQRFKVPGVQFFRDSVIASFKVEANPDPNPDRTAGIAFSWFHHLGDQTDETKYYGVTTHGIQLY
ncbi:MAG: serine/threonine-protein kinase [Thermoleophilaceae bacterium]